MKDPISVSVLGNYLKRIIDAEELLRDIKIFGEVSNYTVSKGIAYFSLKDDDSVLNCVLFNSADFFVPKIGEKIVVTGTPRYYVKGGKLNFNAEKIEEFGEGELYKKFLQLKEKLEREGIFSPEHKLSMPKQIKRIGVVTSSSGAVIQDIINVVKRRNERLDIVLFPARVQGLGADIEIARGVEYFNNSNVDAVIVARGGGSNEDLEVFNSEVLVMAIYNCTKFVVSAVGHETNFTLCDFVADLRAPTPSAAGELLAVTTVESAELLNKLKNNLTAKLEQKIIKESMKIELLNNKNSNLIDKILTVNQNRLDILLTKLNSNNPLTILKNGYAKIEKDGKRVVTTDQLNVSDNVKINFIDGYANSKVLEVEKNR